MPWLTIHHYTPLILRLHIKFMLISGVSVRGDCLISYYPTTISVRGELIISYYPTISVSIDLFISYYKSIILRLHIKFILILSFQSGFSI